MVFRMCNTCGVTKEVTVLEDGKKICDDCSKGKLITPTQEQQTEVEPKEEPVQKKKSFFRKWSLN